MTSHQDHKRQSCSNSTVANIVIAEGTDRRVFQVTRVVEYQIKHSGRIETGLVIRDAGKECCRVVEVQIKGAVLAAFGTRKDYGNEG